MIINDYGGESVSALLVIMRACEIDLTDAEALGWYSNDFALTMNIAVPEWTPYECKSGRHATSYLARNIQKPFGGTSWSSTGEV